MNDFEVLKSVAELRALADETRLQMVQLLTRSPATGSMLARSLGIPANCAHYHLKRLLAAGLVRPVDGGQRARTEERFFAATSRHLLVDPGLAGVEDRPTKTLRQSIDATFLDWRRSQVLAIDWGVLAGLVVRRTLGVRPGDHVLILFAPVTLELAEAILVEVEAAGGVAYPRPWSRNIMLRTLDRYPAEVLADVPLVPPAVDERLTAAVLLTSSLVQGAPPTPAQQQRLPGLLRSVSAWKQSVPARGLRYVHVALPHRGEFEHGILSPEEGIDAFWRCATADLSSVGRTGGEFKAAVESEPDLCILGTNGERLTLSLDPTHASVNDGVIDEEDIRAGRSTEAVPAGSFGAIPAMGTADGSFEADYTYVAGRHIPDVRVELRGGRIVDVTAPQDAEVIRERLANEAGEPGTLSGLTIGLNPGALGPTGRHELDALLSGVVTLHFGNNELWGGTVRSTFNLSLPATGVTLRTRTRTLVSKGKIVSSAAPRRKESTDGIRSRRDEGEVA